MSGTGFRLWTAAGPALLTLLAAAPIGCEGSDGADADVDSDADTDADCDCDVDVDVDTDTDSDADLDTDTIEDPGERKVAESAAICNAQTDEASCEAATATLLDPGWDDFGQFCSWRPHVAVNRDSQGHCTYGAERGICVHYTLGEAMCADFLPPFCGDAGPDRIGATYFEDNGTLYLGQHGCHVSQFSKPRLCAWDQSGQLVSGPCACQCACEDDFPIPWEGF